MRIDAHQHLWTVGRHGFAWPTPDLTAIHRDFGVADLLARTVAAGIDRTVLVQSQPSDADTAWLLAIAAEADIIGAVVGWTDLAAPDAAYAIGRLAVHPKLRGLRPMLQTLERDDWIGDPALDPAIAAMVAHGLRFDALVQPRHLPHLRDFAARHPELPIVIDHGAKPLIADRILDPWRDDLAALAALPNVRCKLSGMLTEARPGDGAEILRPYADHILSCFGAGRTMWGSDWPVLDLAGDYAGWLAMAETLVPLADHAAVFGDTAARFYGVGAAG